MNILRKNIEKNIHDDNHLPKRSFAASSEKKLGTAVIVMFAFIFFMFPPTALAGNGVSLSNGIVMLQKLVTTLILPAAVLVCAWKIVYIAVVPGLIGSDPLSIVSDLDDNGELSGQEIKLAILGHLAGFFKGLLWVGGIFIVFQVATSIAIGLASGFDQAFG